MRAMRARHRGIFDDGHWRFVGPDHDVAVRPGIGQIGRRGVVVGAGLTGKPGKSAAENSKGKGKWRGRSDESTARERQSGLQIWRM
jgi:hypothetical protein